MFVGFFILGLSFGQSSGAVASLFEARNRYTGSALVSDLAWMFGAGFAPVTALLLSTWLGLPAAVLASDTTPGMMSSETTAPAITVPRSL